MPLQTAAVKRMQETAAQQRVRARERLKGNVRHRTAYTLVQH